MEDSQVKEIYNKLKNPDELFNEIFNSLDKYHVDCVTAEFIRATYYDNKEFINNDTSKYTYINELLRLTNSYLPFTTKDKDFIKLLIYGNYGDNLEIFSFVDESNRLVCLLNQKNSEILKVWNPFAKILKYFGYGNTSIDIKREKIKEIFFSQYDKCDDETFNYESLDPIPLFDINNKNFINALNEIKVDKFDDYDSCVDNLLSTSKFFQKFQFINENNKTIKHLVISIINKYMDYCSDKHICSEILFVGTESGKKCADLLSMYVDIYMKHSIEFSK